MLATLFSNKRSDADREAREIVAEAVGGRPIALLACRQTSAIKWGTRWLERVGFDVRSTRDGEQAAALFMSASPAVVVADAALRDAHGRSVCAAIRAVDQGREVPLLVMCSGDRDIRAALEDGATDVARKPFNWQIVSRRAEQVASLRRSTEELGLARRQLDEAKRTAEGAREEARRVASIDRLTGLPNREMFGQMLQGAIAAAGPRGGSVAVLFIDLDRFKYINKALGRHHGNEVLKQIAQRLNASLRGDAFSGPGSGPSTSALARFGGDKFVIMISGVKGAEEVLTLARRLADDIGARLVVGDDECFLTASIGVAMSPGDGEESDELIQHAELAMCEASQNGGGLVRFFSDTMNTVTRRSVELSRALRTALENNEFELHYQPLIDAVNQRVSAAEALLRWEHAEFGKVSPAEFVPLAEEIGLMVQIGTWTLRTACSQLRAWMDDGLPPIRMAVNISLCQLARGDLAEVVAEMLEETGVDARLLELEISERGVLRADPEILAQLSRLKEMGVRLSLDDFGTGNAAIAYLKRVPLNCLKIDRSYVKGVTTCSDDAAIASATIAMARQLDLEVIAEGVEEREQMAFLFGCGCNELQGFLFSPAVPPDDFRGLLTGRLDLWG